MPPNSPLWRMRHRRDGCGRAGKKRHMAFRGRTLSDKKYDVLPFTAKTRMSGVNYDGNEIRKGAAEAMQQYVTHAGGIYSAECSQVVQSIAQQGGTPLVVAKTIKSSA